MEKHFTKDIRTTDILVFCTLVIGQIFVQNVNIVCKLFFKKRVYFLLLRQQKKGLYTWLYTCFKFVMNVHSAHTYQKTCFTNYVFYIQFENIFIAIIYTNVTYQYTYHLIFYMIFYYCLYVCIYMYNMYIQQQTHNNTHILFCFAECIFLLYILLQIYLTNYHSSHDVPHMCVFWIHISKNNEYMFRIYIKWIIMLTRLHH